MKLRIKRNEKFLRRTYRSLSIVVILIRYKSES